MRLDFHPRVWINPIIPALWPIEREMFCAAISQEDVYISRRLRSQFLSYNFARRYENGREAFFYNIKFGLFESGRGEKIDIGPREVPWVEFKLKLKSGRKMSAKIVIINGIACYIGYGISVNRNLLSGAKIIEMRKFIRNVFELNLEETYKIESLPDDLDELSKILLNCGDSIYFLPRADAYEVNLDEGDFMFIGELPGKGAILFPSVLNVAVRGVYFAAYDGGKLEFLATNLPGAMMKLKAMNG